MERLTKDKLLQKKDSHEEDFFINFPGYEGSVRIRPIKSVDEFQGIVKEAERVFGVSKAIGLDLGNGVKIAPDRNNLVCAVMVTVCMIEPDMDLTEVLLFQENTGMTVSKMADRIVLISGLASGPDGKDPVEAELKADPFLSDDFKSKFRISETASLGSDVDTQRMDGDSGVQPDKGSRNGKKDEKGSKEVVSSG